MVFSNCVTKKNKKRQIDGVSIYANFVLNDIIKRLQRRLNMNYLETLNERQLQAVTCDEQYIRVVAGAGSGKTKALLALSEKSSDSRDIEDGIAAGDEACILAQKIYVRRIVQPHW